MPNLSDALRYLRERAGLTQDDVARRVSASGASLSRIYYQQIENGRRFPSPIARRHILDALGSDDQEFAGLLESRPWERPSHPSPADLILRAPRVLAEADSAPGRLTPRGQTGLAPSYEVRFGEPLGPSADPAALRAEVSTLSAGMDLPALEELVAAARRLAGS